MFEHSTLSFLSLGILFGSRICHGSDDDSVKEDENADMVSSDLETGVYPSSCEGLADGYHFLKLLSGDDEDYPVIYARCSNNFMILDYSVDSDITSYFSSWDAWFKHFYGPSNDERINWNEWYLPSRYSTGASTTADGKPMDTFSFLVSPDCTSCDASGAMNKRYKHESAYWMSGNLFGCYWQVKGSPNFEQDWESEKCWAYQGTSRFHVGIFQDDYRMEIDDHSGYAANTTGLTGTCAHIVYQSSNTKIAKLHRDCTNLESDVGERIKPSIGTSGSYCVCVKPDKQEYLTSSESENSQKEMKNVKLETFSHNSNGDQNNNKNKDSFLRKDTQETGAETEAQTTVKNEDEENIELVNIKLYQSDFEQGTYRITQSGTYTVMEDIIFDFSSNEMLPNSEGAYWPTSDDSELYPGAGSKKGAFAVGWFAGITIEANDVVLDLNGFQMGQSEMFYLQQRWFSIIELSNQNFIPGQGPFNAGSIPHFSENIIIKNGKIGPSSHHGIHGNSNKNVLIDNIHVFNFETHGIQLNGFENVQIINTEVGPTSDYVFFNGRYGQGRGLLSRYREVATTELSETNNNPKKVQFYGRDNQVSMQDIVDELELELDFALEYSQIAKKLAFEGSDVSQQAVQDKIKQLVFESRGGDDITEELKTSYDKAIDTFIDGFGSPNGAAQYGIFLNTYGASIATYNLYSGVQSSNAYLENIKIHGMTHKMYGIHPIALPGGAISSLNLFMDSESIFSNFGDWSNGAKGLHYKGNILTDAAMLSEEISNDFSLLAIQDVGDLIDFSFGKKSWLDVLRNLDTSLENRVEMQYNSDTMAHSGKGTQGLRIDAVNGVTIKNIYIYDNHDFSDAEINPNGNGAKSPEIVYYMCTENDFICDENDKTSQGWEEVVVKYAPHIFQNEPMQHGFCGNMNQGININSATDITIENAYINDLTSKTGAVIGISVWPADEVTIKGVIIVDNLNAGYGVDADEYEYSEYPMRTAEVCAVRHFKAYEGLDSTVDATGAIFNSKCLKGNTGCIGEDANYHMFAHDTDSIDVDDCDTTTAATTEKNADKYTSEIFDTAKEKHSKVHDSGLSGIDSDSWGKVSWLVCGVLAIALLNFLCVWYNGPERSLKHYDEFKYEMLVP